MPLFNHEGIAFHYQQLGDGEPIVMCHGLTGDLSAPQALLGEITGYRLIFPEARAHGQTQPLGPESKLSFKQFALDLHALVKHLGIGRAIIGGISMGAAVAARFALDFPDHVRALILIRPAWIDIPLSDNLKLFPLVTRLFNEHGPDNWQDAFDHHPEVMNIRMKEPELIGTLRGQFDAPHAVERRARMVRLPEDCPIESWQEADSLASAALVIGNRDDLIHPYSYAEAWAEHLQYSVLRSVPTKSTHYLDYVGGVRAHLDGFLDQLSE